MALINTSVPNLIQGVSQQPDATRFAGQCEEQENALSSVAEGLKKRPNTRHIARLLTSAIDSNSFVHFINRSGSEKYVVIHDGSKLYAYNIITGNEATINGATGGMTISTASYLDTGTPRSSLEAITVADSTLILNKSVSVGKKKSGNATVLTPALEKKALIFIKQGDYSKDYAVTITGGIVGGAGADITLDLTRYTSSQSGSRPPVYYYAWRVTGVTVNNGGGNYSNNLSVTLSSNASIYTQPVINFNVVGGVIQPSGHTISNNGNLQGVGNTYNTYYNMNTAYGVGQPTITASVVDGNPTSGSVPVTAKITSEDETEPEHADTNRILERLVSTTAHATDLTDVFNSAYYIKKNTQTNLVELLKKDQTEDFNISVSDGLAGSGIGVVYKEVDSISDLPILAPDGYVVKVRGDIEVSQDDYYVKFETSNGQTTTSDNITSTVGEGSWIETVAPEVAKGIDNATMPHTLKNDAVNSFVFEETPFSERSVGDDNSNPLPSLQGQNISNMFFFKNRLGFLSNENVIMTEAGFGVTTEDGDLSFNLMRTSVTTLLDSDPIDISVASSRVTNLKSAKGFQENLVLFSENGQFVLKGGDVLTPKTVSITPITNFSFEDQVDPLPLGSYIYFPFTRGAFTGMREFTINASTDVYDSVEVTEHVPAYIPKNIIGMAGTTSEDMIVLLSDNEKGSLYVYNYFWNNNQKVLSAWSKFIVTGEIRGIEFIESSLYAVITNNGETNLVELPLESGLSDEAGFVTHLDMRCYKTVAQGDTSITLPYTPADNSVQVYTKDGLRLNATNLGATVTLTSPMTTSPNLDVTAMVSGKQYTIVSAGTTDFTALGAADNNVGTSFYATIAGTGTGVVSEPNVWVGIPYTMKYVFSEQLFKAKSGNGTSPSNAAKLMIRNGSIYFDKTAHFKVKVTPKFRDTYENVFTPNVVGSTTIGSLNLDSGFYRFPILTKAQDTTITIENESALPSNFQSAEFESFVHSRSNRYG